MITEVSLPNPHGHHTAVIAPTCARGEEKKKKSLTFEPPSGSRLVQPLKTVSKTKHQLEIAVIRARVTSEFLFIFRTQLIYNPEEEHLWRESE